MKVSDILRIKGNVLYTVGPEESLNKALAMMAERDIGSLVIMESGHLVGLLTVRELTQVLVKNGGDITRTLVREAMNAAPLTCTPATDMDEVLMGVISFHDVARAVVDSQNFENKMLKAYIHDWPEGESDKDAPKL